MRFPTMAPIAALALLALGAAVLALPAPTPAPSPPAAPAARRPVLLEDLTWTELRDAIAAGSTTAIVPIGGTEQSGPALTLGKHNARARLLAERIARELGNAIVAPVVAYVPEGTIDPPTSHMRFAGTISVPPAVFEATLESIARSLRAHGFRDIVFLGDHGGYQAELGRVAARLDREWAPEATRAFAPPEYYRASSEGYARLLRARGVGDAQIGTHAGLADTSLQLALDPDSVRGAVLRSGAHLDESVGIYGGDPRGASAELGQVGVEEIIAQSVSAIRRDLLAAQRGSAPRAGAHRTKPRDAPRVSD